MRGMEESLIGGGGFAARNEALGGCNNGGDGEQKGLGFGGRKGAAAIQARRGWGGAAPALLGHRRAQSMGVQAWKEERDEDDRWAPVRKERWKFKNRIQDLSGH